MATMRAIVPAARDVERAVVADETPSSVQQRKAQRVKLAARSTVAPLSRLVMAATAASCADGRGARIMQVVAIAAIVSELLARTVAPREARDLGALTFCGMLAADAAESATAPAMDDHTSTNSSGLVMRKGADSAWTFGAATQITLCNAHIGAAK
jgi:hypothetical protein